MGNDYGRQVLPLQVGADLQVLAHYKDALWKPGGVTVDWATVTAVSGSDVTLKDNTLVAIGAKALRYGQILVEITSGPTAGYYGPYDATAVDGRAALARGHAYILNTTVRESSQVAGLPGTASNHPGGAFEGGLCNYDRLIVDTNDHELGPAGPALSDFELAFPQVRYANY